MIEQIKIMKDQGHGFRAIARCLGISRNTVKSILRSDAEGSKEDSPDSQKILWRAQVDWEAVKIEKAKGVTLSVLHKEWAPSISYTQFRKYFRSLAPTEPKVTMRLEHKPGEKIHFDFCDGIALVDAKTGAKIKTQLFCGVLPFSSKTWGEFILDQKQVSMMKAVENVFYAFGGVTPYAVFDNLKGAVTRAHIYDPEVNKGFCQFANHWGFAVLPARPYHPQDKGSVERAIGVIQQGFFNEVRNRVFYSLRELNEALWDYLRKLNQAPMKDWGVSRDERFENEKDLLKPLPQSPYEISEWRSAKVHPDCHIQVDNRFYSVPFKWVGKTVQVRLSQSRVEIFSEESEPLAVHPKLTGGARYSTQDAHYPEHKTGVAQFAISDAKAESAKVGPNTRALIDHLLDTDYPLKHLRRAQGIIRLVKSQLVKAEALEYAASKAMSFGKTHLQYVKACAVHYQLHGSRPVLAAPLREKNQIHLHNLQPKNNP
jgi:transposase